MITRRTVLKGMGIVPFLPYIGMESATATPLSDYAKIFKACRDAQLNVCFNNTTDGVSHKNEMIDSLKAIDMSYRIFSTHMFDELDLAFPTPTGLCFSNIFNDVDAIILDNFQMAMPVVRTLICQYILTHRHDKPMFIVTEEKSVNFYRQLHLSHFRFVTYEVQHNV